MSFDLSRLGLLLKRRALLNVPSTLALYGIALAVFVFATFVAAQEAAEGSQFYVIWYGILLIGIGYLTTSNVITELSTAEGRQAYLTLPASNLEKWASAWLFSGPIFVVAFSAVYALLCLLANAVLGAVGMPLTPFELFAEVPGKIVRIYLLLVQPIALIGAIAFNRFAFAKTAGLVMAGSFALSIVSLLAVRIVYRDRFSGLFVPSGNIDMQGDGIAGYLDQWWVATLLFGVLLAVSFFKVKEKEA